VAAFTCPPIIWFDGGEVVIGVVADHSDQAGIQKVTFWMEGQEVEVETASFDSGTEIVGYNIALENLVASIDGDAEIFATVTPVNGVTRVIGPVKIVMNTGGSIHRAAYTLGPGGDFTTLLEAMSYAEDGSIIKVMAGVHPIGDGGVNNFNNRLITIEAEEGLQLGDAIFEIPGDDRQQTTRIRALNLSLRNLHFDLKNLVHWYGLGDAVHIFENCELIDSNGVTGPPGGYCMVSAAQMCNQFPWRVQENQRTCFIDCEILNYCTAGGWLYRGCRLSASADLIVLDPRLDGPSVLNTEAELTEEFEQRHHLPVDLIVESANYTTDGKTTFVLSGSPLMRDINWSQPRMYVKIISGPLAGEEFDTVGQSNALGEVVVLGNAGAVQPGDRIRSVIIWHADSLQVTMGDSPLENVMISGYTATSPFSQPIFLQPGNGNFIDGMAIKNSLFSTPGGGDGMMGQIQHEVRNMVIRQSAFIGTRTWLRPDSGGILTKSLIEDSVFTSLTNSVWGGGIPYGPEFFIANNCHFEWNMSGENITEGRIGTNATGPSSAMLNESGRPLPSSPLLDRGGDSLQWVPLDGTGVSYAPENPIGPRAAAE
jgi:hypothetical protein